MHGEEDGVFAAEAGIVSRRFRVHVHDDVRRCSGVVPKRQRPVFMQQCRDRLQIGVKRFVG